MASLDLADLTETWIVVWAAALIFAIFMSVVARYKGRQSSRPILSGILQFVSFGSLLTIWGIVMRAQELGLISYRLFLAALLASALATGCTLWLARLQPRV